MRELWTTGWMHNRVRMVVASFLVKDLLISWQEGANWFWDTLVDADLASNTLGWQWTAGCGADAAPYFRIFNPASQGEKFDPQGAYVRRWVPELARLPDRWIHQPWQAAPDVLTGAGVELGRTYPKPIVSHSIAREVALEASGEDQDAGLECQHNRGTGQGRGASREPPAHRRLRPDWLGLGAISGGQWTAGCAPGASAFAQVGAVCLVESGCGPDRPGSNCAAGGCDPSRRREHRPALDAGRQNPNLPKPGGGHPSALRGAGQAGSSAEGPGLRFSGGLLRRSRVGGSRRAKRAGSWFPVRSLPGVGGGCLPGWRAGPAGGASAIGDRAFQARRGAGEDAPGVPLGPGRSSGLRRSVPGAGSPWTICSG